MGAVDLVLGCGAYAEGHQVRQVCTADTVFFASFINGGGFRRYVSNLPSLFELLATLRKTVSQNVGTKCNREHFGPGNSGPVRGQSWQTGRAPLFKNVVNFCHFEAVPLNHDGHNRVNGYDVSDKIGGNLRKARAAISFITHEAKPIRRCDQIQGNDFAYRPSFANAILLPELGVLSDLFEKDENRDRSGNSCCPTAQGTDPLPGALGQHLGSRAVVLPVRPQRKSDRRCNSYERKNNRRAPAHVFLMIPHERMRSTSSPSLARAAA